VLFFKIVPFFLTGWTLVLAGFSQGLTTSNARAVGIGNTAVVIADVWAVVNNPAGLAQITGGPELLFSYHNRYLNLGIHDGLIGVVLPVKNFTPALSVAFFGDELLSENRISLAAGHQIELAQLGLRVNYHQVLVQGYGSTQAVSLDMGGLFQLSEQVYLGMAITNLTQAKFDTEGINRLPSAIAVGFSYRPNTNLMLNVEADKTLKEAMDLRLGLEYALSAIVIFRTGLSTYQPSAHFGLGLQLQTVQIDLAGQYQNSLGFSGGFSINIQLQNSP
jgi:hypothetical protein